MTRNGYRWRCHSINEDNDGAITCYDWPITSYIIIAGWWFGTCYIVHSIYGMSSFPLTNSYFSRWLKPPTRYGIIVDIVDLTIKHCSNAKIRWLKPPTSPDQDAKIRNAAERTPLMLGHPELEFYYGRGFFWSKMPLKSKGQSSYSFVFPMKMVSYMMIPSGKRT